MLVEALKTFYSSCKKGEVVKVDALSHIWWLINHNSIIVGLWWFAMIILMGVLVMRGLTMGQKVFTTYSNLTSTQAQWNITLIQAVVWVLKVATWVIIIAMIASKVGIPSSLIAALGTVIGAALGFGSQETVRDVVKGSIHLLEKQFRVGDYVGFSVSGANYEGVIKDVSLRTITIASEEEGVVNIPQGNITLIKNYSRSIGEFVIRLPFDTSTPIAPIIDLVEEVVQDINTEHHEIFNDYLSEEEVVNISSITNCVVRGVSAVDDGRITVQIKGESTIGTTQFGAKRALLKAIAGHLEKNDVQFYSFHLPEEVK